MKRGRSMLLLVCLLPAISLAARAGPGPRLSRAEVLIEQGIYVEAIREIEAHLADSPGDFRARLLLARTYFRIEDYAAVIREAEILLGLRPDDEEVLALKNEAEELREAVVSGRIEELEQVLTVHPDDHETRIMLADALAEKGDYNEAASQYGRVVSELPDEPRLRLRYARFLARIDETEAAAEAYREYLEIEDRAAVRMELAEILAWDGDYPRAMEELQLILEENPRHIEARMLLADMHRWSTNFEQSEALYREILEDSPGYGPAEEGIREVEEARSRMEEVVMPTIEELEENIEADPGDYDSRLMLARLLLRAARHHEAVRQYEFYLARHPDAIMVRLEYATALGSIGDLSGAAAEYRRYLRERPDDIIIRMELARRLKWIGDNRGAETELKRILEEAPAHIEAIWELAQISMNEGRLEESLEYYRNILQLEPSHRAALSMISIIETSPRYLITRYRETLREHPDDIPVRMLLAKMLIEAGRYFEAKTELAMVLDASPGHPEAAILYRQADSVLQRQLREDIAALREAIREDPADYRAQVELAELLAAAGRNEEAVMRYQIYLRRYPEDYEVRRKYAEILSWTPGKYGEARREYEQLITLNPDDMELRTEYARLMLWESSLWVEAEREMLYLIAADPADAALRAELGFIYTLRGMYSDAIQAYESALLLDPSNERALRGISEIRTLMRPNISFFYSRMKDSEDYRETILGAAYSFYLNDEYLVSPSIRRYSFREDIEVPAVENGEEFTDEVTVGAYINSYSVSIETPVDLNTRARAWIGYNEVKFLDDTLSFGVRGEHQLDSKNHIALQYSKYDAIHDVKTVRSLLQEIEIDNISLEWEYTPHYVDEAAPFIDRLSYTGYASYAFYSDANRHNALRFRAFYPLKRIPEIEVGAGYNFLRYRKDSEHYWSPASHSGPAGTIRINGLWRERWSYGFELETAFIQATSNVQRGLAFQLFRDLSPDLTAGIVLTHSEVPREEEEKYTHNSVNLEVNYRF